MKFINLKLAWHFLIQEYQQSHHRLLRWVYAILAVFMLTLSLTSHNIQQYLQQNLQGLLGADAVLIQASPLTDQQYQQLKKLTNQVVETQQIETTLSHQGQWQRAQLKIVGGDYPLQGELVVSKNVTEIGKRETNGPLPGNIWLDARLKAGLSIDIGDTLLLGNKSLTVTHVLLHEPDRLMEGHSVAMRAMINHSDLRGLELASDLLQYRYLLAVDDPKMDKLLSWQQQQLPAAQLLHKRGGHPLALFWKRTENVLGLASIILFFMAAIAIDQLSQVQLRKEQFFSAVCMSCGASKGDCVVIAMFKWWFTMLLLLPVVMVISVVCHYAIIQFLADNFTDLQWQWQLIPMLKPTMAVILIFAIFQMPLWLGLYQHSVGKQLTQYQSSTNRWLTKLSSVVVLSLIALNYSDNALLTFMMVSVAFFTILLMIIVSWGSLTIGEKLTQGISGLLPFSLFMMRQRLINKSTQILGVGLCAFLLLFTLMLMRDLGNTMSGYQRLHDGNLLVSKADSQQMDFISAWAKQQGAEVRAVKPYMYAKVIKVNEQRLSDFSDQPSDTLATFNRSIRLHWSQDVPTNNRLLSGQWWQQQSNDWQQISVEQEVMTDLGLSLGDTLTLFINQQSYQFTITASHGYQTGAGSITFWVVAPPIAALQIQAPIYHMASLELAEHQWPQLAELWQTFPTLRMLSLQELTERFDRTLAMVTKVIGGFSLMIMILSVVVILASIKGLEAKEKKKNSIIMSFGFNRQTCLKLNFYEWLMTALITAVGAITGTLVAGQLIYQSQFSLNYQPTLSWLLMTLLCILIFIVIIGMYSSRNSLRSSLRDLLVAD